MNTGTECTRQAHPGLDWVLRMGKQCINAEKSRGLSSRSIEEIKRWIDHFSIFARKKCITTPMDLTTENIREFITEVNPKKSPAQGKTIV